MTTASLIVALLFIIPGAAFLLIRLYYVWVKGDTWNNMPTLISWGLTIFFAGLAVAAVGVLTSDCPDNCMRVKGNTGEGTMISGAIVATFGMILAFYDKCCNCGGKQKQEPEAPSSSYWSGLDFVFLAVGLAILVTQQSLGECPQSCAEAVVIYTR